VKNAGGADELLHFGAKLTKEMTFVVSFDNQTNGYKLILGSANNDKLRTQKETVSFWGDKEKYKRPYEDGLTSLEGEAGISLSINGRVASVVQKRLDSWRLYHVHDTSQHSMLRKINKLTDNDYLRPDGSNLAAFLYRLQETEKFSSTYSLIVKAIQRVAPFFHDFLLRPDNINPQIIELAWKHKGTEKYFNVSAFSDGTLRFIFLTTLLLQPVELRPSVILIDEPELGLHPAASVDTQVIAATQSPILLDHFEPEDVLVTERRDGGTVFNRLDSEKLQVWLTDYSLGELWEKNYLGGRPIPETKLN
jgi:predicted ATPase